MDSAFASSSRKPPALATAAARVSDSSAIAVCDDEPNAPNTLYFRGRSSTRISSFGARRIFSPQIRNDIPASVPLSVLDTLIDNHKKV